MWSLRWIWSVELFHVLPGSSLNLQCDVCLTDRLPYVRVSWKTRIIPVVVVFLGGGEPVPPNPRFATLFPLTLETEIDNQ